MAALPENGANDENEQADGSLNMAIKISEPPPEVMAGGGKKNVLLVADDAFEKVLSHAVEKLQAAAVDRNYGQASAGRNRLEGADERAVR